MNTFINNLRKNKIKAPFYRRLFAYFIDWYIVSILTILPINLIYSITYNNKTLESTLTNLPTYQAAIAFMIGFILSCIYLIYYPYKHDGQTIGKKIFKIKIINKNKSSLNLKSLIIRNGLGIILIEGTLYNTSIFLWELLEKLLSINITYPILSLLSIITVISLFIMTFTPNHLMLHDLIAKTNVIYKN